MNLSTKNKIKKSNILAWQNKELRENMSKIKQEHWKKKSSRIKLSKAIKLFWKKNPKKLKSMKKKISLIYATTNIEQRISKKLKEMYKNKPNLKNRNRKLALLYYATHEKERTHLLNYKEKNEIKTKLGYVKSSYEKRVADFLSIPEIYKKLQPEYEPFSLYFEEVNPIPDFYLRKLNVLIEVYGLKPESLARKWLKEKYYKKHKIPVIGLTPVEIRDLNKNLYEEAINLSKTSKKFNLKRFLKPRKEWLKKLKRALN